MKKQVQAVPVLSLTLLSLLIIRQVFLVLGTVIGENAVWQSLGENSVSRNTRLRF